MPGAAELGVDATDMHDLLERQVRAHLADLADVAPTSNEVQEDSLTGFAGF
jgi:hypothetical protein